MTPARAARFCRRCGETLKPSARCPRCEPIASRGGPPASGGQVVYEDGSPALQHTDELAMVSLASGIAAWLAIPLLGALLAVVTGHLARGRIRRSQGALAGKGAALAGLALGYVQLAFACAVVGAVLFFGLKALASLV